MHWRITLLALTAALCLPMTAQAQDRGDYGPDYGPGGYNTGPGSNMPPPQAYDRSYEMQQGEMQQGPEAAPGPEARVLAPYDYPRFAQYVAEQNLPSYDYPGRVRVGERLPLHINYYEMPSTFSAAPGYLFTVVDNRPVIVNRHRRVVEVID